MQQNRAPRTYHWYRDYLVRFHEFHGPRLRVAVLEPYHVTQWIQKDYKGQSDSHRKRAVRSIKRVLNWAVDERYIASNPIAHMKMTRPQPRETTITDAQFQKARAYYPPGDSFRDYLTFLWEIGCRPQEIRAIEARHFDGEILTGDDMCVECPLIRSEERCVPSKQKVRSKVWGEVHTIREQDGENRLADE